jgi:hypothetical protein
VSALLVSLGLVHFEDCKFSGETDCFVGSVRLLDCFVGSVRVIGSVRDTSYMTVGRLFWISSSTVALVGDSSLLALSFFGT